jgi:hypothetical protein
VIRSAAASASIVLMLAVAAPLHAQGNGKGKGPNKGGPPSASVLPSPSALSPAGVGTVPFAWIDDASVLPPGDAALSISMMRWQGPSVSEIQVPIVGASMGLTDRVQLGASIPRVAGNDLAGTTGGLGTTYISAKVGVLNGERFGVKLAAAPTIEILGSDALSSLAPGENRTKFGLPISAEIDRGSARLFASGGFFSGGVWFAGGGVGLQATPRVSLSAALSRAWTTDSTGTVLGDRREVSGGVGFEVRPQLSLYGSVSQTIGTADQDGAGTTVSGGVILLIARPSSKTPHGQ